ncbi:MAG: CRISPR-associated helicase Cas3' [Clostridiales bacterium]|nr:CRISPR-associated helicase Cas3' [Clostridiales bacterium]
MLIEDVMGSGKTEAAIYLAARLMRAWNKTGLYMALPTAATSNNMHLRMRELLKNHGLASPRLMHAQSWLVSRGLDGGEGDAQEWLAPVKRAMLSQYAVGTVDQAMLSVMPVKSGVLRLLCLSSKVLILDEIHAYDAYMQEILQRLLQWCSAMGVPVILLSAPLPSALRSRLLEAYSGVRSDAVPQSYPPVGCVRRGEAPIFFGLPIEPAKISVSLEMRPILGKAEDIADLALSRVTNGGCLGVVLNTVADAQEVFDRILKRADKGIDCLLFHARFPLEDRLRIEDACVRWFGKGGERPGRAILVATQTVEQSIDIDLDELITALCPIDLLLQRIGREHRHALTRRPENMRSARAIVLAPESGTLDISSLAVYAPVILRRTLELLRSRDQIELPAEIRPLVERVYDESPAAPDAEHMKEWFGWLTQSMLKKSNAGCAVYDRPRPDRFFALNRPGMEIVGEGSDDLVLRGVRTRDGDNGLRAAILPAAAVRDPERPTRE